MAVSSTTQEIPGVIAFKQWIAAFHEKQQPPDMLTNGNMGRFIDTVNELLEQYHAHGYDGFIKALEAVQKVDRDVNIALSMVLPGTDNVQDRRLTKTAQGKEVFKLSSRKDIRAIPQPKYLISHIMHEEAVTMVYGESSTGKTFFGLHTSICIALDLPWFGRKVKPGRVLYIYAEGAASLNNRLDAWEKYYEHEIDNVDFMPYEAHLVQEQQRLIDTIDAMPEKPVMVVIDTYSNCTAGLDQNKQDDVSTALSSAHKIKSLFHCNVLIIHHTTWQGKVNGSMAFMNHVDTMIELKRENKDDPIQVCHFKNRDIEPFAPIRLNLEVIPLGIDPESQETITSCVVVPNDALGSTEQRRQDEDDQERQKMLGILRVHKQLTVNKWIEECKAVGVSKRQFYDHRDYLERNRLITVVRSGGKGKGIYYELTPKAIQDCFESEVE